VASLGPVDRELLKEALDIRLRKEELEHALGRVLRKRGLDFERYVLITSALRAERRKDEGLNEAALRLISEG
jgi:hypothetical protein